MNQTAQVLYDAADEWDAGERSDWGVNGGLTQAAFEAFRDYVRGRGYIGPYSFCTSPGRTVDEVVHALRDCARSLELTEADQ